MSQTIFPVLSMHREDVCWEEAIWDLTPVENRSGVWFKREDYFAPLGYGGPNGSKLRQLIWLMNRQRTGKTHVLSGASVKSPQLSMSTIVGAHYGLPTRLVIGATTPESAVKHPNVRIAKAFGAELDIIKVAYNPALQRRVRDLAQPDSLVVEYGITMEHTKHPPEDVLLFHRVGASQVRNIPDEVRQLIIPAGSCNSLTSILLGLALYENPVKVLRTYGIGPDKMAWVKARCDILSAVAGVDVWGHAKSLYWSHNNLQDRGFTNYQMEMPESWLGIDFHPTYEGKVIRWLKNHENLDLHEGTMFWIIGSKPDPEVILPFSEDYKHVSLHQRAASWAQH